QKIRSERAEAVFLNSLKDSDLVVYVGHSRDGGGPDFKVPRLNGSRVDYPYYRANRPGLKKLLSALKSGHRRARGLAILSCDSTKFFRGPIQKAAPGLTTMTIAGQVYSEDLLAEGLVAMDFFLRQGTLSGLRSH
ncbi:MAG TPA: hypothetical protein PL182_08925, partial [Pseudobdellovibrionaceae bacterium]|nr:hypothetical protein [Pseudobdellovibrionaceae bacterium]